MVTEVEGSGNGLSFGNNQISTDRSERKPPLGEPQKRNVGSLHTQCLVEAEKLK